MAKHTYTNDEQVFFILYLKEEHLTENAVLNSLFSARHFLSFFPFGSMMTLFYLAYFLAYYTNDSM